MEIFFGEKAQTIWKFSFKDSERNKEVQAILIVLTARGRAGSLQPSPLWPSLLPAAAATVLLLRFITCLRVPRLGLFL